MEAVKSILEAEGLSVEEMEVSESYTYESQPYDDLVIEKIGDDVLSVGQYYKKRMEQRSDPEVRFDVSDPENWIPIEYNQAHPPVKTRSEDGIDIQDFLQKWDDNLQNQFPAEEVTNGGENQ